MLMAAPLLKRFGDGFSARVQRRIGHHAVLHTRLVARELEDSFPWEGPDGDRFCFAATVHVVSAHGL
jgi:hypothetical protein